MKSIPVAITWEFWRQAWSSLVITFVSIAALLTMAYGGIWGSNPVAFTFQHHDAYVHAFLFIFIITGFVATSCFAMVSPQLCFRLPVSTRTMVLMSMVNGIVAIVGGYLALALLARVVFAVPWPILKPVLAGICIMSLSQAAAFMFWTTPQLRGIVATGIAMFLGFFSTFIYTDLSETPLHEAWEVVTPLTVCLSLLIPIVSYFFPLVFLSYARSGQVISIRELSQRVFSKIDVRLSSNRYNTDPMSATLWSEWTRRGIVMPIGTVIVSAILCGIYLTGYFSWSGARGAIIGITSMQLFSGCLMGLFMGHVGPQFDFEEHLATRPLTDSQLADAKLWTIFKSVVWSWIAWTIGVAAIVACQTLVGNGPEGWSDVIPPGFTRNSAIATLALIIISSWTIVSLSLSVVILRRWMVGMAFLCIGFFTQTPFLLAIAMPDAAPTIFASAQWLWVIQATFGTIAIYVTALHLHLISSKRVAAIGMTYLLLLACGWFAASQVSSFKITSVREVAVPVSTCLLPFICFGATPLGMWWNRHR